MQTLFHLVLFGDQGVVSRERTKQALKTGLTGESLREGQDYCKLSPVLFALGFLILPPGSLRMFQIGFIQKLSELKDGETAFKYIEQSIVHRYKSCQI